VQGNIVLDTTGSVIYLDEEQLARFSKNNLVIYLSARPGNIERLVTRFKTSPKPLIWKDHYHPVSGLSDEDSMMSLYPSLLEMRDGMYRALADIEIKAQNIGRKTDLIDLVRSSLPVS
jgi:shikimate kinase